MTSDTPFPRLIADNGISIGINLNNEEFFHGVTVYIMKFCIDMHTIFILPVFIIVEPRLY